MLEGIRCILPHFLVLCHIIIIFTLDILLFFCMLPGGYHSPSAQLFATFYHTDITAMCVEH